MNTNIKALSNEELETISGGGDAVKIVNKILLLLSIAAVVSCMSKFAYDVYKIRNTYKYLEKYKGIMGLYERTVYEIAKFIKKLKKR